VRREDFVSAGLAFALFAQALTLIAFLTLDDSAHGQAPVQMELERKIALPSVSGRIDHLAVDVAHQRLFVAELGNGSVDRIDLSSGERRRIDGLNEPQGIAYLPDRDELVVASAGDGSVRFFDASSLMPLGSVALGDDADNVRVDPKTGKVVVGYGTGALAILDPVRRAVVRTIELGAHPEGFQIDGEGRKAFVNVPDAHKIAVVGLDSGRVLANWHAAHVANFPMALNRDSGTVGIVYRVPARLVTVDAASGVAKTDLPTCDDADDLFFDDKRSRIYVSCGSGAVDVFEQAAGRYVASAHIETRPGARTSLIVPALDRLFVAARAGSGGQQAALLGYLPVPLSGNVRLTFDCGLSLAALALPASVSKRSPSELGDAFELEDAPWPGLLAALARLACPRAARRKPRAARGCRPSRSRR